MTDPETITCTCGCGRTGPVGHKGRQWIKPCATRWYSAGRPDTGPPPPPTPEEITARRARTHRRTAAIRRRRARELRAHGWSLSAIAATLGRSEETVKKYLRGAPTAGPLSAPPEPLSAPAAMAAWRTWTGQIADRIATGAQPDPAADWQTRAACRGQDVDTWVPERPRQITVPLIDCVACPVAADCLTHALTHPESYGIWASTTPTDRRRLRRRIADRRNKESAA